MDTLSYVNGDYSIEDMMTTEVTLKYVLGITFNNSSFNYRYNLNTGEVLNMMNTTRLDKGIDLARYQLAKENPDVDMFINYQLLHRLDNRVKFLGLTLSKKSVIKIGAKGIEYRLN